VADCAALDRQGPRRSSCGWWHWRRRMPCSGYTVTVMQRHFDGVADVAQHDIEIVLRMRWEDLPQNHVAIAVLRVF